MGDPKVALFFVFEYAEQRCSFTALAISSTSIFEFAIYTCYIYR